MINFYKYACSIGMGNFVEKILILVLERHTMHRRQSIYTIIILIISKYIDINRNKIK